MGQVVEGAHGRNPSIFLSYALEDQATARLIESHLRNAGVDVLKPKFGAAINWTLSIQELLHASDYIVLLLSKVGLHSNFMRAEVLNSKTLRELSDRSIAVIPIALDDVEVPQLLRDKNLFHFSLNLEGALDRLVSHLKSAQDIDFSRLSANQFETFVGDLLQDLGLKIERRALINSFIFDFKAHVQNFDPFGAASDEVWLIEAQHHSSGRLSVSKISEFAVRVREIPSSTRVALVTSGQITSAAREMLRELPIRIVEGVELKRLLLPRPHLVTRYFGARSL